MKPSERVKEKVPSSTPGWGITFTLQKVLDDTFGSLTDPEQIANLCRERQIQGFLGHHTSCPMVKLIREQINLPVSFVMGKKWGTGRWIVAYFNKQTSQSAHLVCEQFADAFDLKKYNDLICFHGEEPKNGTPTQAEDSTSAAAKERPDAESATTGVAE